jgi:hypothetical protein
LLDPRAIAFALSAERSLSAGSTRAAPLWRDELDEGKIDAVLAALRVHADSNDEARKCLD